MRIRVEIDNQITDDEVIIKCRELTDEVTTIQRAIAEVTSKKQQFVFYKKEVEYYFSLDEILFFETETDGICAHTVDDIYKVKYRLCELEDLLPRCFVRVSKSTILNITHIYSMEHNITSYSTVQFQKSHKQVYVSRRYYKSLKLSLEENARR